MNMSNYIKIDLQATCWSSLLHHWCCFQALFRFRYCVRRRYTIKQFSLLCYTHCQRRSSRPPNPPIGGGPRSTLGAQVSLKLLFGYVTIFSSADLFTTDLNCRKKLACDIISECYVILSRRI